MTIKTKTNKYNAYSNLSNDTVFPNKKFQTDRF